MNRDGRDSRAGGTMCDRKQSLLERMIDLIGRGSVPVDGGYWVDSRARRLTAVPRAEHSRIPALSAQPLTRQHCA
jgi:hypothetical protein